MEPADNSGGTGVSVGEGFSRVGYGRGWIVNDEVRTPQVGELNSQVLFHSCWGPPCGLQTPPSASHVELRSLISELAEQIGQSIETQLQGNAGGSVSGSTGVRESESERPSE